MRCGMASKRGGLYLACIATGKRYKSVRFCCPTRDSNMCCLLQLVRESIHSDFAALCCPSQRHERHEAYGHLL